MQQVAYDELTAKGYTGSVVAIEPSTGNILAMASTPSYDPNTLSSHDGAETSAAWDELNSDPDKPMLNRAVSATYPPGRRSRSSSRRRRWRTAPTRTNS